MTIEVELPDEVMAWLTREASAAGVSVEQFALAMLAESLNGNGTAPGNGVEPENETGHLHIPTPEELAADAAEIAAWEQSLTPEQQERERADLDARLESRGKYPGYTLEQTAANARERYRRTQEEQVK